MEMEPWDPLDHPARIEVRRQESDDSDAEGGLGNVTRVVLRPPGHSGKAKRGHLCFDASYEGGNLGRVDFISEYEYDLFIRPDTCNPRYRLWFNFVVDNVRADQRVIFNLVNLCKIKTLFRDGMTPLVKTSSRPKWQRLPGKYVYYHKSPEHRNHYILSFAFAFDREEDVYQFAFSFPYSYSRCQAHLELLEQFPHFKRETIGASLQNRKLDIITITNLPPSGLVGGKRPKMVVILARINPGETPTSYIAQGLMDFMVSSHPLAGALRDHTIIKIVPMINPDGSYLGNYRTSLMGYDLNRHWNQVSPWSHPTLHTIKNVLIDLDASKTIDLDMVIDLHAHASLMGCFIYGNAYDDVYRFERHILFPKLLAHNAEDYNPSHTMYNRDPNKAGTARRHLCEILRNTVNVYTMEVSYFGYTQALSNAIITYNEDGYLRLGRNLARTFFEYYKATGIIPQTVLSATAATAPGDDNNDRGGGHKNSMRGGKSRPRARSRTKGKSRDKSHTRSPSNPKDGIAGAIPANTNVNDNDNEDDEGENEMDKTVVKLPQLTKEIARHSDSSDIDSSDEEQVKVRATKNGTIFQQQYIRRRSSTANPLLQTTRSRTDTNGDNVTNVSNNHNGKGHTGKSHQPTGRPVQLLNLSETSPQRGPLSFTSQPNEVEVKKAAYQTFDFSILKEHRHHGHVSRELPGHNGASAVSTTTTTRHKVRRFTHKRPDETENTRKIGGGGIIGRRKGRVRESRRREVQSETETESPCLTIIDFNMLIRKALEGRGSYGGGKGRDGGWRGWSSGHRLRDRREISGHATDGGGGGPSIMLSGRRRNNVRRRRAILLRGTVTDCSPWEEDDEDAAAAVGTLSSDSSDDDVLSPHAASSLKGNLTRRDFNLNKKGNRRRVGRRKRSPATPTLSPSPIFLPQ